MISDLKNSWPPINTWRQSALWALVIGFVLQFAVPTFLAGIGAQHSAFYSSILGFWPMMYATGRGWNSSVTPLGYLLMFGINTLAYGIVSLIGLRAYVCLRSQKIQP
jgi:hypothetical protein